MSFSATAFIENWEVAEQIADDPTALTDVLQELSTRDDPAILGRGCAKVTPDDIKPAIATWLRAFADALAPAPEAEPAPEGQS